MRIETEHRDLKIHYADNQDLWGCHDLRLEATTLSKLKEKINAHLAQERRLNALPVLVFNGGWESKSVQAATATLIDDSDKRHPQVWVKYGSDRRKVNLESIVLDTPENRAMVGVWKDLAKQADLAKAAADAARAAIPRPTVEELLKTTPVRDK